MIGGWLFNFVNHCTRRETEITKASKQRNPDGTHRRLFLFFIFISSEHVNMKNIFTTAWSSEIKEVKLSVKKFNFVMVGIKIIK